MTQLTSSLVSLFQTPPFQEAINFFNTEQWYLAHDRLEELWYETTGQLRELLQAVIQISVAEYHLENGNIRGSILLMAEGLNHLVSSRSLDTGYDLSSLQQVVSNRLLALQNGSDLAPCPRPRLLLMSSDHRSDSPILLSSLDPQ